MNKLILLLTGFSLCITQFCFGQSILTPVGSNIEANKIEAFIQSKMAETNTPGIAMAIVNKGEVVYHNEFGMQKPNMPVKSNTIFEGASLSKPLFGFFVMQFVEQGLLDLDRPLYLYLPYADIAHDDRYKKITARMVLSHRSGFPNWRTDSGSEKLFINFEPGTQFEYSGEGYQYLALVLQEITNTTPEGLERLFHKKVARPLGLKTTRFIQNKKNLKRKALAYKNQKWLGERDFGVDEFGAAYGVHSTAIDYANWLIAVMNKEGLQIDTYDEYLKNQTELPEDNPNKAAGVSHVALGFYTGKFPFGTIYGHGGNNDKKFTSIAICIPEQEWAMTLFTNSGFGEQMGIELFQWLASGGN